MDRIPSLRRPDDFPQSQIDTKRPRTCSDIPHATSPRSPQSPSLSMSNPGSYCHTPKATIYISGDDGNGERTPLSDASDMTRSLQGLCLTASISFNSPRSAGRECTSGEPPKSSPFIYCETDTFGGDKTTRASHANISVFPDSPMIPALPPCKPATRLPGVKNRLELVLAEREIERLSREMMVDSSTPSESNWSAARVRFDDDVKVYEYDKPVYDDSASEADMSGFQPSSEGLEGWSNCSPDGSLSTLPEADDCISAPTNIAFIPLIPNRRLVGGGGEDIEKKHYDRFKKLRSDSFRSPSLEYRKSDVPNLTAVETPHQRPTPIRICLPTATSTPSLPSSSSSPSSKPNLTSSDTPGYSTAENLPPDSGAVSSANRRMNSILDTPSLPTPSYLVPPSFPSPVGTITVQSPTGVDKLFAESLRPSEDSFEPQTPSARSRKGSNRASMDESATLAGGDRTSRSASSAMLGFKSCRSLSPLSRFQTLVTDTIELSSARDDDREDQDNNKRMNSTPAVVV